MFERMHRKRRSKAGARIWLAGVPEKPAPFENVDDLLEAARQMFETRKNAVEAQTTLARPQKGDDRELIKEAQKNIQDENKWTRFWHRSFTLTGDKIDLCRRCRKTRLNRLEREILVAVLLHSLALVEAYSVDCKEIMQFLNVPGNRAVEALRRMSEDGRLYRKKLIVYEDENRDLRDRDLIVDPALLDAVLRDNQRVPQGWTVKNERQLYKRMGDLTNTLRKKSDELMHHMNGHGRSSDFFMCCRKADRMFELLWETLELHRGWGIYRLFEQRALRRKPIITITLALIGKELGHLGADDELFLGNGLARAAAYSAADVLGNIKLLGPRGTLVADGFIQPCGGEGLLLSDDPRDIEKTEFELGDKSLELLGLERNLVKKRGDLPLVREARVQMKQLVLSDKIKKALSMATAQARHAEVLVKNWGLGEVVAYGRAVTMLFGGPPGVGKTACAEAIAHELKKPILVADYSQIQNCYVGMTEKNIVRTFLAARKAGAVLFWDEADAMFYNRDMARQSWEVRDVNVLLQELEKFDGVCILATNRKISLDPALERRITIKLEFDRPDRDMRRKIWRKLMPHKMPLAKDVDTERLSESDLTGGEIKNVVLNAARLALARNPKGTVRMADFLEALKMEVDSRLAGQTFSSIGFGR